MNQEQEQKPFNRRENLENMLEAKISTLKQVELHRDLLKPEIENIISLLDKEPTLEIVNENA